MSVTGTTEDPRGGPTRTRPLILLVTLIVAVVATVVFATGYRLYRTEIQDEEAWLASISRIRATALQMVTAGVEPDEGAGGDQAIQSAFRNILPTSSERTHRIGLALIRIQHDSVSLLATFQDTARISVGSLRRSEGFRDLIDSALQGGEAGAVLRTEDGSGKVLSVITPLRRGDQPLVLGTFLPLSIIRGRFLRDMGTALLISALIAVLGTLVLQRITGRLFEALREERDWSKRVFMEVAAPMVITARDGTILEANHELAALFRSPREELLGQNIRRFYEDPDQRRGLLEALDRDGHVQGMELVLRGADGSRATCLATIRTLKGPEGEVQAFEGFLTDITERKAEEEAMRESEARYFNLFQHAPDMLLSVDAERGVIRACNRAVLQRTGYQREEVLGRPFMDFVTPETADAVGRSWSQILEAGMGENIEGEVLAKDGSVFPVSTNALAVTADDGSPIAVRFSVRDVSVQRELELTLEASRARLRRLYDSVQAGVVLIGAEGEILETNEVAQRIFSRIRDPAGGANGAFDPAWIMVDEDRHPIPIEERPSRYALRTGEPVRDAVRGFMAGEGAKIRWLLINAEPIFDAEQQIAEVVATFQDITELKHTETALRESQERAQRYLDQAEAILLALDPEGRVEMINRKGCEILGREEGELIGSKWFEVAVPPDERPRVREVFSQLIEGDTGPAKYVESKVVSASGDRRLIAWHNDILFGTDGTAAGTFSSGIDITVQRRAESALREALEWRDAIFEGSMDAVFISDEESRFVVVNQAAEELTGYPRNELLEMRIPDLHEAMDLHAYQLHHDRIMGGAATLSEAPILRKDGTKVDVEFNNRLLVIGGAAFMHSVARDVTERKAVEAALREVEERHRVVLATSPDQIVLLNRDLRVEYINSPPPGLALYEVQGVPLPQLVREEERDQVNTVLQEVLESGRVGLYETMRTDQDGKPKFFQARVRRRVIGDQPAGLVVVTRDVTEQKLLEASLKESEARYRLLFDRMTEGFALHEMVWDDEGRPMDSRFLEVNPAFEGIIRLQAPDILGKTVGEVFPELEREWIETFGRVVRTGDSTDFQAHIQSTGTHYHVSAFLARENQFAVTFRDITRQVNTERALRESEERFRSVFENSPLGIVLHKRDGGLLDVNRAFCEILGYTEGQVLQGGLKALSHPEDAERTQTLLSRALKGKIPGFQVEQRYIHRTGRIIWCRKTVSTVLNEDGGVAYAVGLLEDISKSRQAQQDLRDSEARLRALAVRLDEVREEERAFLARELHDELGQVLTGIRMDLAMMRQDSSEVLSDLPERLSRIIQAADAGVELVRGLSSELSPPVLEVMGLGPAIEWLLEQHQGRTQARFHAEIEDLPPSIPKPLAKTAFRIVQESLTNVLRHADAENVWVRTGNDDGPLVLEIEDDGIGIPEGKLFSPSSFGLTGMRERARSRGAELQITDSASGGTLVRFRIEIPAPTPE